MKATILSVRCVLIKKIFWPIVWTLVVLAPFLWGWLTVRNNWTQFEDLFHMFIFGVVCMGSGLALGIVFTYRRLTRDPLFSSSAY